MSSCKIPTNLTHKFEQIIEYNIQMISLLTEISDNIDDPTLRMIITSIIGDQYGHMRLFAVLLSFISEDMEASSLSPLTHEVKK